MLIRYLTISCYPTLCLDTRSLAQVIVRRAARSLTSILSTTFISITTHFSRLTRARCILSRISESLGLKSVNDVQELTSQCGSPVSPSRAWLL